jgi:hypothetical protein
MEYPISFLMIYVAFLVVYARSAMQDTLNFNRRSTGIFRYEGALKTVTQRRQPVSLRPQPVVAKSHPKQKSACSVSDIVCSDVNEIPSLIARSFWTTGVLAAFAVPFGAFAGRV